eukprot:CAMPEP_0197534766 /NCGR_PEP_ID=MMETSP1318-20131121/48276_1 /TAXON_ID=552666 /ORGANISM="Partenskyella glossopodia, Strain RCC365" /LENGTH=68 /DNA_ID=CAMNT_0043092147 /DNA_START=908 /DNA_END=1111 /DNA_ORIENTATION=-
MHFRLTNKHAHGNNNTDSSTFVDDGIAAAAGDNESVGSDDTLRFVEKRANAQMTISGVDFKYVVDRFG